jgi:hypothetical protein
MDWANQYSSLWADEGLEAFLKGILASGYTGGSFDSSLGGLPAGTIQRLFEYYTALNPDSPMYAPSSTANTYPYETYGFGPQQKQIDGKVNPIADMLDQMKAQQSADTTPMKKGGLAQVRAKPQKPKQSKPAGGQDDVVKALLAPGEYVFDAEIVSALGDGSTDAGAKKLDQFRKNIRQHKRTGGLASIPPRAKPVEQYLKG